MCFVMLYSKSFYYSKLISPNLIISCFTHKMTRKQLFKKLEIFSQCKKKMSSTKNLTVFFSTLLSNYGFYVKQQMTRRRGYYTYVIRVNTKYLYVIIDTLLFLFLAQNNGREIKENTIKITDLCHITTGNLFDLTKIRLVDFDLNKIDKNFIHILITPQSVPFKFIKSPLGMF